MRTETKQCQNCKQDFVIEPDDFAFYEKVKVSPPTWCPECRMQRRFVWRNERGLHKRKCGLCGKETISMYAPDVRMNVYCSDCWWSDKWDPMVYGQEYDSHTPLLDQFRVLHEKVPVPALWVFNSVDCDYANHGGHNKNVYLSSSVIYSEDISYCTGMDWSKICLDSDFVAESEWCYENSHSFKNYHVLFALRSRECLNSLFLYDCVNCQDCFMSNNLRNKRYMFRNEQCTKEKYAARLAQIDFGSYRVIVSLRKEFADLVSRSLHKYADIVKSDRVVGDDIRKSKNVKSSFRIGDCENIGYSWRMIRSRDVYDVSGALDSEMIYEATIASEYNYLCKFYYQTKESKNCEYVSNNINISHCFACIGLRNKQYCILNKQYTKEEYEELVPKIIQQMNSMPYLGKNDRVYKYGEFFPVEFSPFAYNETVAQEYFPLTKEQTIEKGYCWKDPEEKYYKITKKSEDLPDNIKDVFDSILEDVIQCSHNQTCNEQCTQAFKIVKEELQFYRKMNLPLPHLCPNCRHYERLKQRNPLKLWHRQCMCDRNHPHHNGRCPNEFETSYSPDRPEIIYCERCYQQEVV